jgi:serine/threonine protein kinase
LLLAQNSGLTKFYRRWVRVGEVYRARDTRLDRTVAIKVLPSHRSADPGLRLRFEREAMAISALQHPNICTLYDVGLQDGVDFLVMECLEGQTLADRLPCLWNRF